MNNTNTKRLRKQLRKHGVTLREVAAVAQVGIPHVCHVLAGRYTSANVVGVARSLLAAKRARG